MRIIYIILLLLTAFSATGQKKATLIPADAPGASAGIKKIRDLIIYSDSSFHSAFPSIIRKSDGDLLLAFRRAPNRKVFGESYTNHVDPTSQLMAVRSSDGGATWSKEPELLYAYPFGGSQDPCLLQLKNGTIICASYAWAFLRDEGMAALKKPFFTAGGAVFLGGYLLRSKDGGKHWDVPVYPPHIDPEINFNAFGKPLPAYNRGAMYESKDGSIFWAVAATDTTGKASVHLIVSKDEGITWKYTGSIASDKKIAFNETSVYETPNGDIVAFLRTDRFGDQACISRSVDGGRTFKWQSMGFKGHPLHALRLPDNRVLLTYGYRHKPYGIRARILNAECTDFKTAPEFVIREDGGGGDLGYTWTVPIAEDQYLITYYYNINNGTRHIAGTIVQIPAQYPSQLLAQQTQAIMLGDRREVFVDHYLIAKMEGTAIVMHQPRREEPVLNFDKPWEGKFSGYFTVIKDQKLFRLYYRGEPVAGPDGNENEVTCYAESRDGISWEKPNLKIYEINGTRNNNVILANQIPGSHNFSPFLDQNPAALPSQKYKAIAGTKKTGLLAYISADGLRWKKLQDKPIITKGAFDSQNVLFWSEAERHYVCYFRTMTNTRPSFRSVSRSTSVDFINWSEPKEMSFGDTPLEHLYTQQTSPYFRAPHIYLAIGARFMPDKQVISRQEAEELKVDPSYFKDCSDVVLMSTRGDNTYSRTFMESFIRPGIGLQNWISRSNYPALNVVQTSPQEMSIYVNEQYAQPNAHLTRYSLRLDGFSSVQASYKGGQVLTKPFVFSGKELEINYATSAAGELRFEILNEVGYPIPGFTKAESATIVGNEIKRIVSWNSKQSLKELAGRKVRMKIYMKDADLYSIKFNP